jgi:hypothetical protein
MVIKAVGDIPIQFWTGATTTQKMTLLSGGALCINATAAVGAELLRVAGAALVDVISTTAFKVSKNTGSGTAFTVDTTNTRIIASKLMGSTSSAGSLTISATASSSAGAITFCGTGTTAKATLLAASNTLQGNGGFAVQGGAASGNALTLTGSSANNPTAKVSIAGSAEMLAFFGQTGAVRQASGENLTNNVTTSGTTGTIADFTDLATYANDATIIRADIYQLSRKLKQVNDALRSYGILT